MVADIIMPPLGLLLGKVDFSNWFIALDGKKYLTIAEAAEAGVDIVDCAIESMSSNSSQPSLNAVVEALRGTERDTGIGSEGIDELSRYYEHVRKVYHAFESGMTSPNASIYRYEIPGGQYSNLKPQVESFGIGYKFEDEV